MSELSEYWSGDYIEDPLTPVCSKVEEDLSKLIMKLVMNKFPLLPDPSFSQDVAFIAFYIDNLRKSLNEK